MKKRFRQHIAGSLIPENIVIHLGAGGGTQNVEVNKGSGGGTEKGGGKIEGGRWTFQN